MSQNEIIEVVLLVIFVFLVGYRLGRNSIKKVITSDVSIYSDDFMIIYKDIYRKLLDENREFEMLNKSIYTVHQINMEYEQKLKGVRNEINVEETGIPFKYKYKGYVVTIDKEES